MLEAAGYQVGVYCNQDWYSNVLDVDRLDLPFWIARYGTNNGSSRPSPPLRAGTPSGAGSIPAWAGCPASPGSVDVNVAYFAPGAFGGSKVYTRPMVRQG